MAVYRVDLLIDDPKPVFEWIEMEVPKAFMVRAIGYRTYKGWYMKIVFKRPKDAESLHRRWHPETEDHSAHPWNGRHSKFTAAERFDRDDQP